MSQEDVALIKKVGFDSYRFSIAWTRILPGMSECIHVVHHFFNKK